MAKQEFKFKISVKELSIECEGTRDVGQAFQAEVNRTFGALVNAQRRAMDAAASPAPQPRLFDDDGPVEPTQNGHTENGHAANGHTTPLPVSPPPAPPQAASVPEKKKPPRRSTGPSITNLLRELKKDNYFKEPRSFNAIREKLKDKGHTLPPNRLSGRLTELAKKDELFRQRDGDGDDYVYKDSKFDESPRTADAPDEPVE